MGAPVGLHLVDVGFRDHAFRDELPGIDRQGRLAGADVLVHQRLREGRLVALVVAEAAVAEHVDDHRLVELLPELGRDLGGVDNRFRIVAIGVEDRRLDDLGDVGGIGRGAREARIGGEADLVVDDEMDGAGGPVAAQPRQAEALGDHPLPGEGRVAMEEERQDAGAVLERHDLAVWLIGINVLLGARFAEHHRIDDLEMRRIGGQRQVHRVAVELAVGRGAEMVLDVAGALDLVGRRGTALEFMEDRPVRLAENLGEHVEAAAVGHAEHDLLDAELAAALDDLLQRRDERLAAVEAEALGAGVFDVEKAFEAFRLDQLVEDRLLALGGEGDALVGALDALLDPGLLGRIGNVHELDAEGRAVGPPEDAEHLRDGREFEAEDVVDVDLAAVVGLGEAVGGGIELVLVAHRLEVQRIEIGVEMAAHAVGADHHDGAHRIARRPLDLSVGHLAAAGGEAFSDLRPDRRFGGRPVPVEGRDQLAVHDRRPVGTLPGRPASFGGDAGRLLQPFEEGPPIRVDRVRIAAVAGVHLFDERGVRAVKERRCRERGVGILACHFRSSAAAIRPALCSARPRATLYRSSLPESTAHLGLRISPSRPPPGWRRDGPATPRHGFRPISWPRSCPRRRPDRLQ